MSSQQFSCTQDIKRVVKDPDDHLHARLLFNPGRKASSRRCSTWLRKNLSRDFKSEAGAVINVVVQLGVRKTAHFLDGQ